MLRPLPGSSNSRRGCALAPDHIFDAWPERYDQWFQTPIGRLIREYESRLMLDLLRPAPGEHFLDAGCGTGVFTVDLLRQGSRVAGLEISRPMLLAARDKCQAALFRPVQGDMLALPFADGCFDKVLSMTAIEFIAEGRQAVQEMFRVTKKGGLVVVSTLNSRSPWAERRKAKARDGDHIFQQMIFRSPEELDALAPVPGELRSAIHFQKNEQPAKARSLEQEGSDRGLMTGAFLAARWKKDS